jgi:hypothetical protein
MRFKIKKYIICPACKGIRTDPDGHTPCIHCKGKGVILPRKFKSIRTKIDGIVFHSKAEAQRYCELKLKEKFGLILDLETQPVYKLIVNGQLICKYIPDFRYKFPSGKSIVEDFKGKITHAHTIKKKLMKAVHGIEILETKKKG